MRLGIVSARIMQPSSASTAAASMCCWGRRPGRAWERDPRFAGVPGRMLICVQACCPR